MHQPLSLALFERNREVFLAPEQNLMECPHVFTNLNFSLTSFQHPDTGKLVWRSVIVLFFAVLMLSIEESCIIYCAVKTVLGLRRNKMSNKSKDLQMQLFKALVAQVSFQFESFPVALTRSCSPLIACSLADSLAASVHARG